jgi:hypothetical protein
MTKRQKTKLRFGPYQPPSTRPGRRLFCQIAGTVTVGGYSDGKTPWPYAKHPGHPLILCGALLRAVRREAAIAVAHHWGVCKGTVRRWRRALDVPPSNEGTHELTRQIALSRDGNQLERARAKAKLPKALKKLSESLKGRVQSPATLAALLKAAKGPRTVAWKQKMSEYWRRRGHPPGHPESNFWTEQEDELLGTATDAAIARAIDRTWSAVCCRREKLGIPPFRQQRKPRRRPKSAVRP